MLNPDTFQDVILEQGDILNIPEKEHLWSWYMAEVAFPNGIEYKNGLSAKNYIEQVGGFSQKSNKSESNCDSSKW